MGTSSAVPELTVVLPTISGREKSLQCSIDSYDQTLKGEDYDIIVIQDAPTWPEGCNAGYYKSDSPYILFGADDLDALPGWWECGKQALVDRPMELPAPRVYDMTDESGQMRTEGEWRWANPEDGCGEDGALTEFTRVPLMSKQQWETIGPWPSIIYYADLWLSDKARTLGIRTRMVHGFDFFHRWSQIGRVDSKKNMDESGWELRRLRREMA